MQCVVSYTKVPGRVCWKSLKEVKLYVFQTTLQYLQLIEA